MSEIELSVIIVSWNVRDLLFECLKSLFTTKQDINFEVIVVDNNSTDGTVSLVAKDFPQVRMIVNDENEGFAFACHQGVDLARGRYYLFLNDDTVVTENALADSLDCLKRRKQAGVLGCRILNSNGTTQPSVRKLPTCYDMAIILLKLHNFFPGLLHDYLCDDFDYQKEGQVEQVMGAFFLTTRTVWKKLGGFDRNFYIWFEEVDYCLRARNSGFEIIYFPGAKIKHYGGASFGQLSALPEQKLFNNSLKYYARKNFAYWHRLLLYFILPLNYFLTILVSVLDFAGLNPKKK
jgi:GT2 family glycosyltransferase